MIIIQFPVSFKYTLVSLFMFKSEEIASYHISLWCHQMISCEVYKTVFEELSYLCYLSVEFNIFVFVHFLCYIITHFSFHNFLSEKKNKKKKTNELSINLLNDYLLQSYGIILVEMVITIHNSFFFFSFEDER